MLCSVLVTVTPPAPGFCAAWSSARPRAVGQALRLGPSSRPCPPLLQDRVSGPSSMRAQTATAARLSGRAGRAADGPSVIYRVLAGRLACESSGLHLGPDRSRVERAAVTRVWCRTGSPRKRFTAAAPPRRSGFSLLFSRVCASMAGPGRLGLRALFSRLAASIIAGLPALGA